MTARRAKESKKPMLNTLKRSVSFGEYRDGKTIISKPGTSPTTPRGRKYPLSSPPLSKSGPTTPNRAAGPPKTPSRPQKARPFHEVTSFSDEPALPFFASERSRSSASPKDQRTTFEHDIVPLDDTLESAIAFSIRRLANGDIEYGDGRVWRKFVDGKKHAVQGRHGKRTGSGTPARSSNPTTTAQNLPALLDHSNLQRYSVDGFKFKDIKGWRLVCSYTDLWQGVQVERLEKWMYSGTATSSNSPSTRTMKQSSRERTLARIAEHNSDESGSKTDIMVDSPSRKAKKNKKAREKKAHAKLNTGRRQKLPLIPKSALQATVMTRSRAKQQGEQLYALP